MYKTKAYSAASATSPLAHTTIPRRDPTEHDVQIEILFCGICHSDLHSVRNEWSEFNPTVYPIVPGHRRAVSGEAGADAGPMSSTALAQAQAELKTVLDDPKHTKAEVDEKITTVRKARESARANLVEAQRDLMRLLTPTQQAVMVSLGYLE